MSSWLEISRIEQRTSHDDKSRAIHEFLSFTRHEFFQEMEFPRSSFRIDFQNSPPIHVNLHNSLSAPACSNRFCVWRKIIFFPSLVRCIIIFFFNLVTILRYFKVLFNLKSSFKNFIQKFFRYYLKIMERILRM